MGIIEPEELLSGEDRLSALPCRPGQLLNQGQTRLEGLHETLFLGGEDGHNPIHPSGQFRIGSCHQFGKSAGKIRKEGGGKSKVERKLHGATNESSQDIAAPFVGGNKPLPDKEGARPDMVGNDPIGEVLFALTASIGDPGLFSDGLHQGKKEVGLEVAL